MTITGKFETSREATGGEKEIANIPEAELLDKSLEGETEVALQRIEEVASRAEALAESDPALRERAMSLRDRARKLGRQVLGVGRMVGLSASVLLAAEAVNYELTRYNVSERADDHGRLVFEHQDQETTYILDYLSGKGELPEADRLVLEVKRMQKVPNLQGVVLPKKLEEMNEEELSEAWDEMQEAVYKRESILDEYKKGSLKTSEIPVRYEYNEELYNALWHIEREAGNPKIRFEDFSKKNAFLVSLKADAGVAHYDPGANTIYVSYPPFDMRWATNELPPASQSVMDDFVAEASHGKQWKEKPVAHYLGMAKDDLSVLVSALRNRTALNTTYQKLYNEPGTFEYEAHTQIQPELEKKLAHYEKTEAEEREKKSQELHAPEGGSYDEQR